MKLLLITTFLISFCGFSQNLIGYSLSDCQSNSDPEYIRNRIVSKEMHDDTLSLSIGFSENCCISPKPLLDYSNDTLYIQIDNVSNNRCGCDCCYELKMEIRGIPDTTFTVVYKKIEWSSKLQDSMTYELLYASSSKFIFPSPEEITSHEAKNAVNENGFRVGLWRFEREGKTYKTYFSENPTDKQVALWSISYDQNGLIYEVCAYDKFHERTCVQKWEYDAIMK